jgi:hypothetical protein
VPYCAVTAGLSAAAASSRSWPGTGLVTALVGSRPAEPGADRVVTSGRRALLADVHRDEPLRAADAWPMRPSTAAWNRRFQRRVTSGRSTATGKPENTSVLLTWVPPSASG